eukprot:Blabericola_migrator_1__2433@NODE_1685_length_4002_cov_97_585260_g1092_i0_p4_GENE_NODE_1685_length_4002_cov_97_585260_g1092_i0NODE_1685_length_4002_cov_97_585260_g1092_i0_p4_ORF_typecomplete_len201_score47_61GST_N/PF02798_20/6e10GST_N_3/PF13417_6/2_3e07Tom37/PF10568_9/0_18_NODE_1685_length_4002_cov_97_585260_g1092_i0183785
MVPVLYYFKLGGRAEAIRCAFIAGDIDFEDRRVSHKEFYAGIRDRSPNHHVPFLEIDDKIYIESRAILQYVCQLKGMVGSDPREQLVNSMLCDRLDDFWAPMVRVMESKENPQVIQAAIAENKEFLMSVDQLIESHIGNNVHVCKDKPYCAADLSIMSVVKIARDNSLGLDFGDLENVCPHMCQIHDAVLADNPRLKGTR